MTAALCWPLFTLYTHRTDLQVKFRWRHYCYHHSPPFQRYPRFSTEDTLSLSAYFQSLSVTHYQSCNFAFLKWAVNPYTATTVSGFYSLLMCSLLTGLNTIAALTRKQTCSLPRQHPDSPGSVLGGILARAFPAWRYGMIPSV